MKKTFITIIIAVCLLLSVLCGCGSVSGIDGRDGQDLNIYDIYEAANSARREEGLNDISFLDFLREYLNYDFQYSGQEASQAIVNRSLMSCVAVFSGFSKYSGIMIDTEYHAGSGVIVELDKNSGSAYILTNCHVIYDDSALNPYAESVNLLLYGNDNIYKKEEIIKADIVGATLTYDLALLKVSNSEILKNSDAAAAIFADEEEVYAGETVYAIGNPEGLGLSITEGIITKESEVIQINLSDLNKNNSSYNNDYRVIRTDAAVNGGNSGGGLFNQNGRLLGIVNSKISNDEVDNMGFALAGSYVKRIWPLMRDGYSSKNGINYRLKCSIFPGEYSYTSSSYFNNEISRVVIEDKVVVTSSYSSIFSKGDVLKNIKITDESGNTVENLRITRYFNVDDVLLSAKENYKIIYTVLRDGSEKDITTSPLFSVCE